jgi:hypothetical protein
MTRFVALGSKSTGILTNEKYVKQTYEALSHSGLNLEVIAMQLGCLPVREQRKFLRLIFNYVDVLANTSHAALQYTTMQNEIKLAHRLIDVVNDHYFEQEEMEIK